MNSARNPLNLLLLSTPVGALGSGLGGGVELTLRNIALELMGRGHSVDILAPMGSGMPGLSIAPIGGKLHTTAQTQGRNAPIEMPGDSVLANMWEYARENQDKYDLLVNFAYDWLPFYLTPFLETPIAHLVSMGSLTLAMDAVIGQTAVRFPGTIGVHSRAQAETFEFADRCRCLGNGIDLKIYDFCAEPENYLGWVGRIAPEKGIEDAIAAADRLSIPLKIWGAMPDLDYWDKICMFYPDAAFTYEGFLSTKALQKALGRCQGLLMTHKWVEAFGNVAIEALACGVPVISYQRGGPAEIVQDGVTGWLVKPDSLDGLVEAIAHLPQIDRQACRYRAEAEYSMLSMGDRMEAWFYDILEAKV
ncbi:MAG: glycosyltransferase family 4 protein [Timaviella obliquedivisa GSE-PSE-MK23-08B]|nr:glycosyltransferase family 4 protein [Timaviella obliquedivisa GSE-PSE-MK23-08B]